MYVFLQGHGIEDRDNTILLPSYQNRTLAFTELTVINVPYVAFPYSASTEYFDFFLFRNNFPALLQNIRTNEVMLRDIIIVL